MVPSVTPRLSGFRGSLCTVEELCSAEGTGDSDHTALDRVSITVPYSNTSFQLEMLLSADNPRLAPGQSGERIWQRWLYAVAMVFHWMRLVDSSWQLLAVGMTFQLDYIHWRLV